MAKTVNQAKTQGLAAILKGLQEVEALDAQKAALREKTWKASEIKRLLDHFRDSPEYGREAFEAIREETELAEREGRVLDDLSPTVANLTAKHGEGSWILPASMVGGLYQLARDATKNPHEHSTWAQQRAAQRPEARDRWMSPVSAMMALMKRMAAEGRIATSDKRLGLVYGSVAPHWGAVSAARSHFISADQLEPDDETMGLVEAQRLRWEAIGKNALLAAERIRRADPDQLKSASIEEILGEQPRGARWEPFASRDELKAGLYDYDRFSRRAIKSADEASSVLRVTGTKELRELVVAAADRALFEESA